MKWFEANKLHNFHVWCRLESRQCHQPPANHSWLSIHFPFWNMILSRDHQQRFCHFKTFFRSNLAPANNNHSLPTTTTTTTKGDFFSLLFVPTNSDISSTIDRKRTKRKRKKIYYIWKSREWISFTKGVQCEFYAGYCVIDGILLVWEGNNKMIKIFLYFGSSFM